MAYADHLRLIATAPGSAGTIDPATIAAIEALIERRLDAADRGDTNALFDLGCAFSTGSHGAPCDLVEAHKWFNLAAAEGHEEAQACRAEVADEMSAREIAEAQRRARAFLAERARRAA